MANDTIIKVEGLSKHYLLNKQQQAKSDTLYGSVISSFKNIKHFTQKKETIDFWALNDVSFDIQRGDRVGIIGRNGAGKSTLLKILSRITPPTKGRIEITGKVASLLEVGTGFHGDLSGRENIYLNGSILGMTKQDIDKQFDAIVEFAEVENFLDTPVKRYSSGMYVRLAFAVAAHLNPDILIVDEVLAVGDAAFQKKCIGKMKDVSSSGRTILFVSHHMASIQSLCNKALVLKAGQIDFPLSSTDLALKHYMGEVIEQSKSLISNRVDRQGEGFFRFKNILIKNADNQVLNCAQTGQDLYLEIDFELKNEQITNLSLAITVYTSEGIEMFTVANHLSAEPFQTLHKNQKIVCWINKLPLNNGSYLCNLIAYKDSIIQDYVQEGYLLEVEEGDFYGTGKPIPHNKPCFLVDNLWELA